MGACHGDTVGAEFKPCTMHYVHFMLISDTITFQGFCMIARRYISKQASVHNVIIIDSCIQGHPILKGFMLDIYYIIL